MREDIWRSAIDEVGSWEIPIAFRTFGMGEPLLHPRLWDIVAHAAARPTLEVAFFTNGMLWTDEDYRAAVETGIHKVTFSIDGVRPEFMEYLRRGAAFAQVESAVYELRAARERARSSHPLLSLNMVRHDEIADDVPAFVARWRDVVDEIVINRPSPPPEHSPRPLPPPPPFDRIPCQVPDHCLGVTWDGQVGMCGVDCHGHNIVGHFPARSLAEIWNGEEIQRIRRLHLEGRWDEIPICVRCDAWCQVYNRVRHEGDMEIVEDVIQAVYRSRRVRESGELIARDDAVSSE